MKLLTVCVFSAAILAATSGFATTAYDEDIDGDLSGVFASPTPLTLALGLNSISGQMGANGGTGANNGSDGDYFSITVPAGTEISSLTVDEYVTSENQSFIGYRDVPFVNQSSVTGFVLFGAGSGEILSDLTGSSTLGPGTHYFWVQETAPVTVDYTFTFTQIPEPATTSIVAFAAAGLGLRRRRG